MTKFGLLLVALGVSLARTGYAADVPITFRQNYTGSDGDNSWFGGGYSLSYGYSLTKNGAQASASADAQAAAWVKVLGITFDAVSVSASGNGTVKTSAPTCSASVDYSTYLVGIKLPGGSGNYSGGGKFFSKRLFGVDPMLVPEQNLDLLDIGIARLGIKARVQAHLSVLLDGQFDCAGIGAEVRPEFKLTAAADLYGDLFRLVEFGVNTSLNFLDFSLPASLNASWTYHTEPDFIDGGSFCAWNRSDSASVNVNIQPLSGFVRPYMRVGLPCVDLLFAQICLNKKIEWELWSSSLGTTTYPLAGAGGSPGIGDNTATCPPPPAVPPTR